MTMTSGPRATPMTMTNGGRLTSPHDHDQWGRLTSPHDHDRLASTTEDTLVTLGLVQ